MHDPLTFEARLADAFGRYVAAAPIAVDAAAVARNVVGRPIDSDRHLSGWPRSFSLRLAIVVGLVTLALVAVVLLGGGWPAPFEQPVPTNDATVHPSADGVENGSILLWAGDSFVAIAPDGRQTTLPIGSHSRSCPTYSPDGRTIAFLRNGLGTVDGELALADADGSSVRALWTGRFSEQTFHQVLWSADGSTVIATKADDVGGGRKLAFARPNEGISRTLDIGTGEFPATIALSPDGRRIAALWYPSANPDDQGVVVVDSTTGNQTLLVGGGAVRAIAWSPTGETIAYIRDANGGDATELRFVRSDGSDDRLVAIDAASDFASFLAWSRDGRRLAALQFDGEPGETTSFSVHVFDAAGATIGRLGPFRTDVALSFTWAPDGRSIVLTSGAGEGTLGSRPLVAHLDGRSDELSVPADYYAQCPLGWAPARP